MRNNKDGNNFCHQSDIQKQNIMNRVYLLPDEWAVNNIIKTKIT